MRHEHAEGHRCPVPGCKREAAIRSCQIAFEAEIERARREGREPKPVMVMFTADGNG